jgi:hypothetical protein
MSCIHLTTYASHSHRTAFQNLQSTVQHWNDEILNCVGDKTRLCVNYVKHREVKVFTDKAQHGGHTTECYGHVVVMSAPPVVAEVLELEDVLPSTGPGRGRGRANPKAN